MHVKANKNEGKRMIFRPLHVKKKSLLFLESLQINDQPGTSSSRYIMTWTKAGYLYHASDLFPGVWGVVYVSSYLAMIYMHRI